MMTFKRRQNKIKDYSNLTKVDLQNVSLFFVYFVSVLCFCSVPLSLSIHSTLVLDETILQDNSSAKIFQGTRTITGINMGEKVAQVGKH